MALPDVAHCVAACERRRRQWSDTPRFAPLFRNLDRDAERILMP
jgi:hypothetical protein